MRVRALEVPFAISCGGSGARELARAVAEAWAWCLDDEPPEQCVRLSLVLDEGAAPATNDHELAGPDLATLMDRLSPTVTRLAVGERAGAMVMLHACALADPRAGGTVVLFGPSGAGKTTVARVLGTELAYLTDETAAVDADHRVRAYPKPLSVLPSPGAALKEQVSPDRLGLIRPNGGPYPLRAVIQLLRDPAHVGGAREEVLATVDALAEMVAQTSYSRELDRPLQRLASLAHAVGGVRRVTYADASQLRPVVQGLLGAGR